MDDYILCWHQMLRGWEEPWAGSRAVVICCLGLKVCQLVWIHIPESTVKYFGHLGQSKHCANRR